MRRLWENAAQLGLEKHIVETVKPLENPVHFNKFAGESSTAAKGIFGFGLWDATPHHSIFLSRLCLALRLCIQSIPSHQSNAHNRHLSIHLLINQSVFVFHRSIYLCHCQSISLFFNFVYIFLSVSHHVFIFCRSVSFCLFHSCRLSPVACYVTYLCRESVAGIG